MRRRKFSREFKLEAARFAQATDVRLGLVAPGIWTARLEDSPGLGSRRNGAVRTNLSLLRRLQRCPRESSHGRNEYSYSCKDIPYREDLT
jgi:transposase-like protein